jgi:hypothetical protein
MKVPADINDEVATEANMYDVLGISSSATEKEVRRAYRNLITKARRGGFPRFETFIFSSRKSQVIFFSPKRCGQKTHPFGEI